MLCIICTEYLSVRCIWHVIIMSRTHFRVNLHATVAWMLRTPCSKQRRYLKFAWNQRDSNATWSSPQTKTQPFSQNGQIIEPCCEYLPARCIWQYAAIMSLTTFKSESTLLNAWLLRNSLLKTGVISDV